MNRHLQSHADGFCLFAEESSSALLGSINTDYNRNNKLNNILNVQKTVALVSDVLDWTLSFIHILDMCPSAMSKWAEGIEFSVAFRL